MHKRRVGIKTTPPSSGGSDILGPTKMQMASSPPSHWVGRSSEVSGFSVTERLKPARLLRLLILILLLRSGINPNPGPGPYFCFPCSFRIKRTQPSVWCHICGYIHLKCSGLTHLNQHHPDYYCPTCTSTYILPPPGTRSSNLTTPNSQTCSTSLTAPNPTSLTPLPPFPPPRIIIAPPKIAQIVIV